MHDILISDGAVNIDKLFTPTVLGVMKKITRLAKKIPRTVTLRNGDKFLVTPAVATGVIAKIFNLKVKRNVPTWWTLHHMHDHEEDILVYNNMILIVVWRQFERVPRPVYTHDPTINAQWKSAQAKKFSNELYSDTEREAISRIWLTKKFKQKKHRR